MASEMQVAVDAFVSKVMDIVRRDVVRALASVGGPGPRPVRAASGAPRAVVTAGQKRDPKVLAETVQQVAEYIQANPGMGIEQIGPAVNHTTSELALPIRKLLEARVIVRKGHKRSSKYFPAASKVRA